MADLGVTYCCSCSVVPDSLRPMDCSSRWTAARQTSVLHRLLAFDQIHAHQVGDVSFPGGSDGEDSDALLNPGSVTQCWLHVRPHLRHLKSLLRTGPNPDQLNQESLEVISAHHYFKKLASGF